MKIRRAAGSLLYGISMILATLICLVSASVQAKRIIEGDESSPLPFPDDAQWIWAPAAEDPRASSEKADEYPNKPYSYNNTWMRFRTTIPLLPEEGESDNKATIMNLRANIAVDSKYWLWATCGNDDEAQLLVREGGLKRGPTPVDTWYDSSLHLTINCSNPTDVVTIAILVWYWGADGFSHNDSGQGGLLLYSNDGHIVSQPLGWKVQPHPAYQTEPHNTINNNNIPNYRLAEHNVYYDARYADDEATLPWTHPKFNDSAWSTPIRMGKSGTPPWNQLFRRTIPQWKHTALQNYTRVRYTSNTTSVTMVNNDEEAKKLIIEAKLPYNAAITPFLRINNDAYPTGIRIDIQTDNYRGGGAPNVRSTYITRKGPQSFESFGWMNGHIVYYIIHHNFTAQEQDIISIIRDSVQVEYRETGYDTTFIGGFHSNDSFLNKLWEKARRTLYLVMRDNFMDCPDRERGQWFGDVVVELGQVFYAFDIQTYPLMQKAIMDLVRWQRPRDEQHCFSLYAPVPSGNWHKELPIQMLSSIHGIYTYYLYTGDLDTIRTVYPSLRSYLKSCWTMNATDGLVNHRHGDWDWEDWGTNYDSRILDNAWYTLALKAVIEMASSTGHAQDIAYWKAQLTRIHSSFDSAFWNGTCYISPEKQNEDKPPDDRANALAVLAGLVPMERNVDIVKVLKRNFWSSPYMEKYVLESLFHMGYPDVAVRRMKYRYNAMVNHKNITTLWEYWDLGQGTYNHGWSGGPLTLLSQYSAGIAPTSPGWKTSHVLPQEGASQTHLDVVVPTNLGTISLSIRKTEQSSGEAVSRGCTYQLKVTLPAGSTAKVGIPKFFLVKDNRYVLHTVRIGGSVTWVRDSASLEPDDGTRHFVNITDMLRPEMQESDPYVSWRTTGPRTWVFEGSASPHADHPVDSLIL